MPFITNNGVRVHYQVEGSGEPLVLYHGLTGSGERWRDTGYTAGLRDDYRLILIDARGHGLSDKPHDPAVFDRRLQAADVVAVLDDLAIPQAHFWGHSLGGNIALTLGRYHPQCVSSLVITGYSPFAAEAEETAEMASWASDLAGGMPSFVAGYEERHGTLPDDARARWLANDGLALSACVANMIAEADGRHVPELPLVKQPTLLLVGSLEPFFPRAEEAAGLLPQGRFIPLPGLDHVQTFFREDLVLPHVRAFLARAAN